MRSRRGISIALLAGLFLLVSGIDEAVAQACASMATGGPNPGWKFSEAAGTDTLTLQQDRNFGNLTGTYLVGAGTACPVGETFNLTGQISSRNGQFSLTGTYAGCASGCSVKFVLSGTVSSPGCNNANGSWQNWSSNGDTSSGTFTMSEPLLTVVPPVKLETQLSVCVPEPVFTNATEPAPSEITPENVAFELLFPQERAKVGGVESGNSRCRKPQVVPDCRAYAMCTNQLRGRVLQRSAE